MQGSLFLRRFFCPSNLQRFRSLRFCPMLFGFLFGYPTELYTSVRFSSLAITAPLNRALSTVGSSDFSYHFINRYPTEQQPNSELPLPERSQFQRKRHAMSDIWVVYQGCHAFRPCDPWRSWAELREMNRWGRGPLPVLRSSDFINPPEVIATDASKCPKEKVDGFWQIFWMGCLVDQHDSRSHGKICQSDSRC